MSRSHEVLIISAAVGLAVVGIGGAIAGEIEWNQHHTQTCTVESKQATGTKDGGHSYMLFTRECGALQVADAILQGKFNSTDTYAGIKEGHVYTMDTVGWRNGLFSQYPNVLTATELNGK